MGFVRADPDAVHRDAAVARARWTSSLVPRAFAQGRRGVFGSFVGEFISWAGKQVLEPARDHLRGRRARRSCPTSRRPAARSRRIIKNPIRFVGNLVRAGKHGFQQFAGNFLTHLKPR